MVKNTAAAFIFPFATDSAPRKTKKNISESKFPLARSNQMPGEVKTKPRNTAFTLYFDENR
jgi:hypothetical protein